MLHTYYLIIIFEFHVPPPQSKKPKIVRSGEKNKTILGIEVELKRVGKILAPKAAIFTNGHKSSEEFDDSFPVFITAGDISKDGSKIVLRGKDGKSNICSMDSNLQCFIIGD